MAKLEYDLSGKGVFVIIKLTRHNFSAPWDGLTELDYETDQDKLLEQFNLATTSSNVLLAEDLTNEAGAGGYDDFMDTLRKQLVDKDEANAEPSFVMFVLLSHGTVNGGFLLATPNSVKSPVKPCGCPPDNHRGGRNCHVRYITRDLMAKVDAAFDAHREIPKIYIMQTCRGDFKNVVPTTSGDRDIGVKPSEIELFSLNYADSFLLRPCVEGNGCWATPANATQKSGSFLIKHFCEALSELWENARLLEENLMRLRQARGSKPDPHEFDDLIGRLGLENHAGGWLTNICQRTTSLVANILVKDSSEKEVDKQQPHYSSSLAYKFSCLKMLKTEWE